jgi:uncharacterized protein YfdQ (DUF2303 family)
MGAEPVTVEGVALADVAGPERLRDVVELVERYVAPTVVELVDPNGRRVNVLVLPTQSGLEAHPIKQFLDPYAERPDRREGTARLEDLDSFIAHAERFKDDSSALFACSARSAPSLTSVLDYHEKNALEFIPATETAKIDVRKVIGAPRFGKHRGVYAFPLSDEWKAWTAQNGVKLDQAAFAEFIEAHLLDLAEPSNGGAGAYATDVALGLGCSLAGPSKLLELSRGLSVRVGSLVTNSANLATGEAQLTYQTQHTDDAGAPIRVPGAFLLAIPVFKGGAPYQIPARLRYRIREKAISWFFELHGADRVFDHAFGESCARAAKETNLPLFRGSPE